jgi:hypothetical protein
LGRYPHHFTNSSIFKVSAALPAPLSYNLQVENIAPLRSVSGTLVAIWVGIIRSVLQDQSRSGTLQITAAQKGEYVEIMFSYVAEEKTGSHVSARYTSGYLASVPYMGVKYYMALLDSLSATWSIETTACGKVEQVVRLPIVP